MFFLSCTQSKNSNEEERIETQAKVETDSIHKTVTLSIEPKLFKLSSLPDSVNVKMMNNTNDTIITGLHYEIEHFKNNQWLKASPDQFFNDIGFSLTEGKLRDFEIKLLKKQIDYEVGKYRITKYYLKHDYQKTKQTFEVFAQFDIE